MISKKFLFIIIFILILGSIARITLINQSPQWKSQPDHMAWQLNLDDASKYKDFSYSKLIHYPHEGGSIIISLLAIIFGFLFSNSLVIVSIFLDFLIRLLQSIIIHKIIGEKVALVFGLWTLTSTPSLVFFSEVSFGTHYFMSISPFIIWYLLYSLKNSQRKHLSLIALIYGILLVSNYINIIILPVIIYYLLDYFKKLKTIIKPILIFSTVILLHLAIRVYFNPGFNLLQYGLNNLRGIDYSHINLNDVSNLVSFFTLSLPQSTQYVGNHLLSTTTLNNLFSIILILSLFLLYFSKQWQKIKIPIFIFLCFACFYSISPFFCKEKGENISVLYRHIMYITPLLFVIILSIITHSNQIFKYSLSIIIIVISMNSYLNSFKKPYSKPNNIATGWVLAQKYGHDPLMVERIINEQRNQTKQELIQGIGWGISTIHFENLKANDPNIANKVLSLNEVVSKYPKSYQEKIWNGIQLSFNQNLDPKLDPKIKFMLLDKNQHSNTK